MLLLILSSCSSCSETEHTEGVTADITAAQMMGRNDAREFINREWADTATLVGRVNALRKARRDSLSAQGHPENAAAYDSAFISTVRAVRPPLARAISRLDSNPE